MQLARRAQIRAWLRESRMTQQELAAAVDITPAHLSQILNGHRSPSLRLAVRLEQVTSLAAAEWFPAMSTFNFSMPPPPSKLFYSPRCVLR